MGKGFTTTDLLLAMLGTRREDLPVAVFDEFGNLKGVKTADEANGIIEGEYEVKGPVPPPYSKTLKRDMMLPGETYPEYLQRKWGKA